MRRLSLSAAILGFALGQAQAECKAPERAFVRNGFLTAEDIQKMSQPESIRYIEGFVNGLYSSAILGAPAECISMAVHCMPEKMSEFREALSAYIDQHPEERTTSAVQVTFEALMRSCLK